MNKRRHNRLLLPMGVALMLVILLLAVSCGLTKLEASGTVYGWVDAPAGAGGEIYVDTAAPTGRTVVPLGNVRIGAFGGAVTARNGTFDKSWGVPAGRLHLVDVKIEKEGYHTLEWTVTLQALKEHSIVIFLVPR